MVSTRPKGGRAGRRCGSQIDESSLHRDVGRVHGPDLIRSINRQMAQAIGIDPVCLIPPTGAGFAVERFNAHLPHHDLYPTPSAPKSLSSSGVVPATMIVRNIFVRAHSGLNNRGSKMMTTAGKKLLNHHEGSARLARIVSIEASTVTF